jgi:carbamate kinase
MEKIKRIIIALGGNALQPGNGECTAQSQLEAVYRTSEKLAEISSRGYEMGIVHGNGPQVGSILLAYEAAKDIIPEMPFDVCGAMSQGYIGYHLQQGLRHALEERNLNFPVLSIVTQTVVSEDDQAFSNPTKPVGPFYSKEEMEELVEKNGYDMVEDSGRGYRRVVPSPIPQDIVEISAIRSLWDEAIVIAAGGGGVPVIKGDNEKYEGIAAVIDKDFSAELLAEKLGSDALIILTGVEKVAVNFNKPNQKNLDSLTVEEAEKYIEEGQFAPGSMLPKVMAALKFVNKYPDKFAVITSLDKVLEALEGKTGTLITK